MAVIVVFEFISSADAGILLFIQEHLRNAVLDPVMCFFSLIGNAGIFWILTALLLIITSRYRRTGFLMLLCLAMGFVVCNLTLKNTIQRIRPFIAVEGLEHLMGNLADADSWSFPSGHTCSSFAAAYALTRGLGKKGALFYVPAAMISFSRLYIGVHYPSDVLAGAATGTVVAIFVHGVFNRLILERNKRHR